MDFVAGRFYFDRIDLISGNRKEVYFVILFTLLIGRKCVLVKLMAGRPQHLSHYIFIHIPEVG